MNIIKAVNLVFDYIRRDEEGQVEEVKRALDHVNLEIEKGSFVAILCVYFSYVVRFFLPWRQRYRESFCLQMTFIQIMKIPDYNCNKHLHN